MINIANLPLRTPQIIAKSFATLDILTKGRIELGIGAGVNWKVIEAYGGSRKSIARRNKYNKIAMEYWS
jgi:alkanesulfonate monooxygenase SsuD/methylene tetrahydromethanopterin reductase-like flavin-dependent oxidoreductase (luciferase family)